MSVSLNFLLAFILVRTIMKMNIMRDDLKSIGAILDKYRKLEKPKKSGSPMPQTSRSNKMKWKIYDR